jgi:hypothetical protein
LIWAINKQNGILCPIMGKENSTMTWHKSPGGAKTPHVSTPHVPIPKSHAPKSIAPKPAKAKVIRGKTTYGIKATKMQVAHKKG